MLVATQGGYYKGFTLIELLAIIVILAIIAVITVPIILNIIEDAQKNSSIDSAYGYKSALEKYYMKKVVENTENELPNGYKEISDLPDDFTVSGESPSDGWVNLANGNVTEFSLKFGDYVVTKLGDEDVVSEKSDYVVYNISEEYQRVEYLESKGTQYINTGYIPSIGDIYNIRFANIKENDNEVLMGCRSNGDYQTSTDQIYLNLTGNNKILSFAGTISQKKENRIQNKNYEITFGSNDGNFSNNAIQTIYIFALNDKGTTTANAYSKVNNFKIYNNNELVRNLVPVIRKSDNKPGLLDLANLSRNLFDKDGIVFADNSYIKRDGTIVSDKSDYYISDKIYLKQNSTYTWVFADNSVSVAQHTAPTTGFYNNNDELIGVASHNDSIKQYAFTVPENCAYIRQSVYKREKDYSYLYEGTTALPYEPYKKSFYTNDGAGEFITGPEI